jgi:predicted nucleic acid-binding protein
MEQFFIDASFVLAVEVEDDSNHEAASQFMRKLSKRDPLCVTTDYVIVEIVNFLTSRRMKRSAVRVGHALMTGPEVCVVHVDQLLLQAGWQLFKRRMDKDYSLTDCISFEVMRRRKLTSTLTFDHHFAQAGFKMLPEVF